MDPDRRGLLIRALHVRDYLDHVIASTQEGQPTPAAREFVEAAWRSMWTHHAPWLKFCRCVDHASRYSIVNPHFTDDERAGIARDYFARTHPDLAAKLDMGHVTAAIAAWRTQKGHWKALREAVLDFNLDAPATKSMARQWSEYPHLPAPGTESEVSLPSANESARLRAEGVSHIVKRARRGDSTT